MPISRKLLTEGLQKLLIGTLFALGPWMSLGMGLSMIILSTAGCERCSRTPPLAQLEEKRGPVERDRSSSREEWFTAEVGTEFEIGDAIFTKEEASAVLNLEDGSKLGLEAETIVRFLDHEPGSSDQRVDLQMGAAFLEAGDSETTLRTTFGRAKVEAGARVRLSRSGRGLLFDVQLGSAIIENAAGEKIEVAAGRAVEVALGQAKLELVATTAAPPNVEPGDGPPGDGTPDDRAPDEEVAPAITADVRGDTVRLRPAGAPEFARLGSGPRDVTAGSTFEVGRGSSVRIQRGNDVAELSEGGIYVVGGRGGLVEAKRGTLRVSSQDALEIAVPGGVIVTRTGTATVESRGKDGTRVTANEGEITLRGKTEAVLEAGDAGTLSVDGDVSVEGRGPAQVDVVIRAGQSVTIHDPRPPTAIRVAYDGKCQRGILRLSGTGQSQPKGNARGKGSASFLLQRGTIAYALHCVAEDGKEAPAPTASGKVSVLMDAGTRPVPHKAPFTAVDLDGRSYTVLYQNLLPQVSVRWSKAPEASQFKLHVDSGSSSRVITTSQASHTFSSGSLREGSHTFYFEGGGRVSRQTKVFIRFDNAATTASLSAAGEAGGTRTVSGTALPGWTVTVDGKSVAQDAQGRFSVASGVVEGGRPTAIVLTHPSRGTHVYLRR